MGINRVKKRGKTRIEVRKRWPDRTTYRRYFPNMTAARHIHARIEESIVTNRWSALKKELSAGPKSGELPVSDFAEIYLEDYCRIRNSDVAFKQRALKEICKVLGDIPLKALCRSHAHRFVAVRGREVSPATVNRNLAVLKSMLTFALERECIDVHPLSRFRLLPEERTALRVMSLDDERELVEAVAAHDLTVGAYVALLGETGLRKQEGLKLQWKQIDSRQRMLAVEKTKSRKPRYIPLSEYAMKWLGKLVRIVGCPYVFVSLTTGTRLKDPRSAFDKGKRDVGLDWVTFHSLRHFRATQWVKSGVDLRTVKELLGHSSIQTTMRYAHFAPDAFERVRRIQERESSGRQMGDIKQRSSGGLVAQSP